MDKASRVAGFCRSHAARFAQAMSCLVFHFDCYLIIFGFHPCVDKTTTVTVPYWGSIGLWIHFSPHGLQKRQQMNMQQRRAQQTWLSILSMNSRAMDHL